MEQNTIPPPRYEAISSKVPPEMKTIEHLIDKISPELRELSLKIHAHPELAYKEYKTAKLLTGFMEENGFKVSRSIHGIETAWSAEFVHSPGGKKGPTIGLQSEMDALPGIGHACGHNLIAISGVATALALAEGLKKHSVAGRILLLGTPAEEDQGGKIALLKAGAYDSMDVCLMMHPNAAKNGLAKRFAVSALEVEYFGHNAHAALAPWEGVNALDAAVLAYTNLSVLRQQVHPNNRMHGIIQGSENWVDNVIPSYSKLTYGVRSPELAALVPLRERVENCCRAAAEATGCRVKIEWSFTYYDVRDNSTLGKEYAAYLSERHGIEIQMDIPPTASTDFGNVSYQVPSITPIYQIPSIMGQGPHTPEFAKSAATEGAHLATLRACKALAVTCWRAIVDAEFLEEVRKEFEEDKKKRGSFS